MKVQRTLFTTEFILAPGEQQFLDMNVFGFSNFHCILYKEIEHNFSSQHQNKNAFLFPFGSTGIWVFILCLGLI